MYSFILSSLSLSYTRWSRESKEGYYLTRKGALIKLEIARCKVEGYPRILYLQGVPGHA